jgi:hypothetical protein
VPSVLDGGVGRHTHRYSLSTRFFQDWGNSQTRVNLYAVDYDRGPWLAILDVLNLLDDDEHDIEYYYPRARAGTRPPGRLAGSLRPQCPSSRRA